MVSGVARQKNLYMLSFSRHFLKDRPPTMLLYCLYLSFVELLPNKTYFSSLVDLSIGAMYWESAKSGTQQAMGCCSWFSSCVRPHADEAVPGIF